MMRWGSMYARPMYGRSPTERTEDVSEALASFSDPAKVAEAVAALSSTDRAIYERMLAADRLAFPQTNNALQFLASKVGASSGSAADIAKTLRDEARLRAQSASANAIMQAQAEAAAYRAAQRATWLPYVVGAGILGSVAIAASVFLSRKKASR